MGRLLWIYNKMTFMKEDTRARRQYHVQGPAEKPDDL
jgi:hypothetical protein